MNTIKYIIMRLLFKKELAYLLDQRSYCWEGMEINKKDKIAFDYYLGRRGQIERDINLFYGLDY